MNSEYNNNMLSIRDVCNKTHQAPRNSKWR